MPPRLIRIVDVNEIDTCGLKQLRAPHLGIASQTRDRDIPLDESAFALSLQHSATKGKATHYMYVEKLFEDICAFVFYGPRNS